MIRLMSYLYAALLATFTLIAAAPAVAQLPPEEAFRLEVTRSAGGDVVFNWAIAEGAPHPEAAHAFNNWSMTPESMLANLDYIGYHVGGKGNAEDDFMIPPDRYGEHGEDGGGYQHEQRQQVIKIIQGHGYLFSG